MALNALAAKWKKSIESSKAGSGDAHRAAPRDENLLVNFDKEIMQLMRETKYLRRMGIEVPEREVVLPRRKSSRRAQPTLVVLKEYGRVMSTIVPWRSRSWATRRGHGKQLEPGMYALTWSSMNIDAPRGSWRVSEDGDLISKMNGVLITVGEPETSREDFPRGPPGPELHVRVKVLPDAIHHKQTEDLVVRNVEIERAWRTCELVRNAARKRGGDAPRTTSWRSSAITTPTSCTAPS